MGGINPYVTPDSDVQDISQHEEAEVKVWSFRGRLGRVRYLAYLMSLFFITWIGGGLLAAILIPMAAAENQGALTPVMILLLSAIYGVLLIGSFSFAIRRIHDFNASGWLSLLLLVPLVNVFFGLALWFIPGTDGANHFGTKTPPNGAAVTILAALAPIILIGYIGVIAAIAIPQYQAYVQKAQEAQMRHQQ